MLIGAEPRGLPGTTIDRVEFQRAAEGHPLDDIIVHAHDSKGDSAVLEIQVKRNVTFAPSDQEFKEIVGQVVRASGRPSFPTGRYEFAAAVARSSRRINGPYQDVLTWARRLGSHTLFFSRVNRSGSANDDMRRFVNTFRTNLHETTLEENDEFLWRVLSRMQILPFDYTARGSSCESWDKERAAGALHSDASHGAGDLLKHLIETVVEAQSSGGDFDQKRLIEHLGESSFRLAGRRDLGVARASLSEAARHALADVEDQVGDVSLLRTHLLNAVRSARTQGRYIEIRGDGGVGKSALLKHFAQQLSGEAPIIVLSPKRVPGGGWLSMRLLLRFDGSLRSLLVDLASSGGATLFLDGLDFFSHDERMTVCDLVREASEVSGFDVIATARRNFGLEEPNWLPTAALERLGHAEPVAVGELNDAEVNDLKSFATELSSLLAESHPARAVTRNLFRLSRLAKIPGDAQVPRSEVDMAEQWWKSADGAFDELHRERVRVLGELAEQALSLYEPLETKSHPASAVDALVRSQTLRDLDNDRMAFHHDVIRDWAIANLLYSRPDTRDRLPLGHPAPASLVRGVELAARMALERKKDDSGWREWIDRVSGEDAHGSWRRAVLMAPVRSELHTTLLSRVSDFLLDQPAHTLREFVSTIIAVDGTCATPSMADTPDILEGPYLPAAPSWVRLIRWLIPVAEVLPASAIPQVARLFIGWSASCGNGLRANPCVNKLRSDIIEWLHRRLSEIEAARYPNDRRELCTPFGGALDREQIDALEANLRTAFLALCDQHPSLASEYVQSQLSRGRQGLTVKSSIIRAPGMLAYAAPQEVAELVIATLISSDSEMDERRLRYPPFLSVINLFSPPASYHGPFPDLLNHAPRVGLIVVQQIVDYAIAYYTKGRASNSNAIHLHCSTGDRVFHSPWTYAWARAFSSHDFCVTSALMALRKWGERRIRRGDPVRTVLNDVFRGSDRPAAYLLLAVDLLIDAWPASREVAIPFLACPELLCLDRNLVWHQYTADRMPGHVVENPVPRAGSARSLIDYVADLAVSGPPDLQERLASLLWKAAERLGPYDEQSGFDDPRFMAFHAMNLLDRSNWKQATERVPHGPVALGYVAPPAEAEHLARLEVQSRERVQDVHVQAAIMTATEDAKRSSSDIVAAALRWTRHAPDDLPEHRAIVTASALLVARDGDDDQISGNEDWVRRVFVDAKRSEMNPLYERTDTLSTSPPSIAFAGMSHLLMRRLSQPDIRFILELSTRDDCAAALGFATTISTLHKIDRRLPRSILRAAFVSCIRLRRRDRFPLSEQRAALTAKHQRRVRSAIEAEQAWLGGRCTEPEWPPFPHEHPTIERGISIFPEEVVFPDHTIRTPSPTQHVSHRRAALWLNSVLKLPHDARLWKRKMTDAYGSWTARANGLRWNQEERVVPITEWNASYYALLADCLSGMGELELEQFALSRIIPLPDSAFIEISAQFLLHVDRAYFAGDLNVAQAGWIRAAITDRLVRSYRWQQACTEWRTLEWALRDLVARLFMHDGSHHPPQCWLRQDGMDLVDPLLPTLHEIAGAGPSIFLVLGMIEVDPRPDHLGYIVAAAEKWLTRFHSSSELWIDHAVGNRVCHLIESCAQPRSAPGRDRDMRARIYHVLASLTSQGVVEAAVLERALESAESEGR